MNLFLTLLCGAIAGWLAGFFVKKEKGGLFWNIIIGLIGGWFGGFLIEKLNVPGEFWGKWYGYVLCALIGAVILLSIWNLLKSLIKK